MKLKVIKLTESEIDHLVNLIKMNEEEGSYYGYVKHYWSRSKRIRDKLEM